MPPYVVITGCPRSGTQYIAMALRSAGVAISHEALAEDGIVDWRCMVNGSLLRQAIPAVARERRVVYLHQVRHPLKVISSLLQLFNSGQWKFDAIWGVVRNEIPCRDSDTQLYKLMAFWYYWNTKAESSWYRYRIDGLEDAWDKIWEIIGRPRKPIPPALPTDFGTIVTPEGQRFRAMGKYPIVTWETLRGESPELTDKIWDLVATYGYE